MKKIVYSLFATAILAFSGCSDDLVEQKPVTPAQEGSEISFGSSLKDAQTRTIYDDTPYYDPNTQTSYYRVSWEADGSDQISIYCPEASNGTLVNYSVTPDPNDATTSSAVTKVNADGAGLQWGAAETHHFYGFYPASAVTGTESGKIRGYVPPTQNVDSWNKQPNNAGGTNYYGKTNTDLAYMWAYGEANRSTMGDKDVSLTFHPWMTVVQVKLPGPVSGEMKVSNFNIRAIDGSQTILSGDFVCDMNPVIEGGDAPNYEAVGNTTGAVRNQISISGWDEANQDFITLTPNDTLIVRAYLLPVDEAIQNSRELQIRVQPMNGAVLTRTLGYSGAGETATIQPHKVNTVILPRLRSEGTNYWMSSLDRGIYLSELSLPGSKFSYLTPSNAGSNAAFQGEGIEQQFQDGVRAFIVQVGANATYNSVSQGWGSYNCTYTDATLPIYCGGGDDLSDAITHIANALATAETTLNQGGQDRNLECAVVMITYSGNNAVTVNFTGDTGLFGPNINTVGGAEHVWMEAIANRLKQLGASVANRIYTDPITANTTLDDVKGKIILKVNTNSDAQNEYIAADDNVPALFSRWNGATNTVPLRWGSPNTSSTRTPLNWMYQEATHVGNNTEITAADKYSYAINVFTNSISLYEQNDEHNTWFMNDCGGTFQGQVSGAGNYSGSYGDGDTNDEAPIAFARWFNPQITSYLQQRDANASLGLVFFNFADKQATGRQYGTDNLIQTIIDNNFKFNLRTATSSDTPSGTQSYDSGFANGGNAWQ